MPLDSSIPLQSRPIQAPDLLGNVGQVLQLRHLIQAGKMQEVQGQEQQIDLQQKQQDLQDQQTLRQAMADAVQKNPNATMRDVLPSVQGKVSPKMFMNIQQQDLSARKDLAEIHDKDLKTLQYNNDQLVGLLKEAGNLPPDQYAQSYPMIKQRAQELAAAMGKPLQLPDAPVPQNALPTLGIGVRTYDQYLKGEADKRAAAGDTRAAAEESRKAQMFTPELAAKTAQAGLDQHKLEMIQNTKPEDMLALVDQVVNPKTDQALNMRTRSMVAFANSRGDVEAAKDAIKQAAGEVRQLEVATDPRVAKQRISIAVATQAAKTPQISDSGLDLMAEKVLNGESISSRNPVLYAKAMNRAAELAQERGMSAQGALLAKNAAQAYNGALKSVTKQYETLKPFADMAEKNADILEKRSKEVSDLGASFFNTPLRELESKFGSTRVAAFKAALLPVQADFARILNSPTGGGVLSDHARDEMRGAIQPGATVGQIRSALEVFRTDAKNRRDSYEATIKDLQSRSIAGGSQPAAAGPTATHRFNPATGKIEEIK